MIHFDDFEVILILIAIVIALGVFFGWDGWVRLFKGHWHD